MDEIVLAAMRKWPNVPACHGWLALDARGDWYMRDLQVQAAGAFPRAKGSRVAHEALRAFIGRNYQSDAQGRWYFQNGPQQVFVDLEAAPWIFGVERVPMGWWWHTHTGRNVERIDALLLDEMGRLYLETPLGLGLVRSADMVTAEAWIEAEGRTWAEVQAQDLPTRFGFELTPR